MKVEQQRPADPAAVLVRGDVYRRLHRAIVRGPLFPPRQTAPADDVAIYFRHRDRVLVTASAQPGQALSFRVGF
ncbi:MAG TPA: hypothetical protein VKD71_12075 [Gemmataceae bacterium]|nr:hypothetical protein [Gemmataceae bacterium]